MEPAELNALVQNKVARISKVFTEQIANLTVSLSEALERNDYLSNRIIELESQQADKEDT